MHARKAKKNPLDREVQRAFKMNEALCVSSLTLPKNRKKDDCTIC